MVKIDYYATQSFLNLASLQSKIAKAHVDASLLDAAIFWFTNIERQKHHLKQLKFHAKLRQTAILHSEQMKRHNFFSHDNIFEASYKTLTDRINSVKDNTFQGFMSWGENIADSPVIKANETFTVENRTGAPRYFSTTGKEIFPYTYYELAKNAVAGWMTSLGHRANILNPDFEFLGCGSTNREQQEILTFLLTQNFGGTLIEKNKNYPELFKSLSFGINKNKLNRLFGDLRQKKLKI